MSKAKPCDWLPKRTQTHYCVVGKCAQAEALLFAAVVPPTEFDAAVYAVIASQLGGVGIRGREQLTWCSCCFPG